MDSLKAAYEDLLARLAAADPALVLGAGALGLFLLLALAVLVLGARRGRRLAAEAGERAEEMRAEIAALLKTQAEMSGRMQSMAEIFGSRQSELNKHLSERLDGIGHRLNQSVGEATKNTTDNLRRLHERLAVLDHAQKNISELAGQVTTLSNILGNKQSRGAFGQSRMEAIIADGLPKGAYLFQATLKSGARPDCLVTMPNEAPPLVIDAKFPLEGYHALKAAETPETAKAAQARFRTDLLKHIADIKERYLIPGETQDTAFMFVPSEAVFAEIHEHFEAVVQRAYRAKVVIVSPSLLMLSIQVVQALLRDARLREQAHVIQEEVMHLMVDLSRLDERVRKLATHFGQANKDIDQILISTDKLQKRGAKIEGLGFGEEAEEGANKPRLVAGGEKA
ncbi:DNA recombination protein RmuC [Afifella pfennigii]|uniref:DNA recombination protein RmuC n=1 Tax=Afifella pfennigii TaxID=209897 RepID=UPI00068C2B59|nr:DNA recombination protein RmuC [Afifella pfennigii]